MTTATLLTYRSEKLGDVPYGPDDVVRFPAGVPGFEHLQEFLVVTRDECAPFVFLAALADPEVALPLLPLAYAAGPDGAGVPVDVRAALDGESAGTGTLACYTVVSIGPDAREVIVNLRAPVVIDLDARRGSQVIVPDETVPLSAPLRG
jgi:flagellar assembly factor FliW